MKNQFGMFAVLLTAVGMNQFAQADGIYRTVEMRRGEVTCHFSTINKSEGCNYPTPVKIRGARAEYKSDLSLTTTGNLAHLGGVIRLPEGEFYINHDAVSAGTPLERVVFFSFSDSWKFLITSMNQSKLSPLPFIVDEGNGMLNVLLIQGGADLRVSTNAVHSEFKSDNLNFSYEKRNDSQRDLTFSAKEAIVITLTNNGS